MIRVPALRAHKPAPRRGRSSLNCCYFSGVFVLLSHASARTFNGRRGAMT
ncbi:hypothetical protein [Streptomyces buecherae]